MNFLRDPFTQFLVNSTLSLLSIIVATLALFISKPTITNQNQNTPETKLPNTAPLPTQPLPFSTKLAIASYILIILYCIFETIAILYSSSPYPKYMIFIFLGGALCCLYLLTPSGRHLIQKPIPPTISPQKKKMDNTTNHG